MGPTMTLAHSPANMGGCKHRLPKTLSAGWVSRRGQGTGPARRLWSPNGGSNWVGKL